MRHQLLRVDSASSFLLFASVTFADTMRVSDDSNINLNTPGQSNGTSVDVLSRNVGSGGIRHGFMRFDLSPVPPAAIVERAILRMFVNKVDNEGDIELRLLLFATIQHQFHGEMFEVGEGSSAGIRLRQRMARASRRNRKRWSFWTGPRFDRKLIPNRSQSELGGTSTSSDPWGCFTARTDATRAANGASSKKVPPVVPTLTATIAELSSAKMTRPRTIVERR